MLIKEAAEHLVTEYRLLARGRMAAFHQIVAILRLLFPAEPEEVVLQEVVRNFAKPDPSKSLA